MIPCRRCEGLMVYTRIYARETYGDLVLLQCLQCGNATDPIIAANSLISLPPSDPSADYSLNFFRRTQGQRGKPDIASGWEYLECG